MAFFFDPFNSPFYRYRRTVFLCLVVFAGLFPVTGYTQLSQPARFELAHEDGDHSFTLVSLKENGIAVIRQKEKSESNKKNWEIVLLDTTLRQTWSTLLPLDNELTLIGYEYDSDELFYLFRKGSSNQGDLHLIRVYLFTHVIQEFDITPKLDFRLTHFTVVGNSGVLGGYVNRQPSVLIFEMATTHLKVVPGFFVDNTEMLEVKANRNKTFNILLVERGTREKKHLMLKTFDETGTLILEDDIELDATKNILAGTTSTLENDELFLAGTWGLGASKQSSGFFSVLVDPFNKQAIRYQDFSELQHFFDYMPAKRATRTKSRGERRRKSQKNPYFRTDVHVVKMEESSKGFLLLAELYIPAMISNYSPYYNNNPYYGSSPGYYNPYGFNPMTMNRNYYSPYNNSPFSNYSPYGSNNRNTEVSIVHSSLVLFDQQGKLQEDFGFAVEEVHLQTLDQVSDFYASEKFVQFYKKDKDIYVATNWADGNSSEQDTLKIQLKSAHDVIRNEAEDQGGVRYWFGAYAYAWGFETIKNKTQQSGDQVRYVYYVNKIRME